MKDTSFFKLFKYKKYKDLYDIHSIEFIVSFISVISINIILFITEKYIGLDGFVNEGISFIDNIGMAFIGLLGFIVTGLAILTGAISSKVVKHLQNKKKMQALEEILLSFYLLGLLSAFEILFILFLHFISLMPIPSIKIIDIIILSLLTYSTVFIIFYAVKLIGNCLELFYILNNMQIALEDSVHFKNKYNQYRISALEKIVLSKTSLDTINEYKNTILELIGNDNISEQEKNIYQDMVKKQFDE